MHELDMIRAAAEDVDSAQILLRERTGALDAIVNTALDHGIPPAQVAEAAKAAEPGQASPADPLYTADPGQVQLVA